MPGVRELAETLGGIGFACTGCSECCRAVSEDSNLVAVGPREVRAIMAATGMTFDEIAEPYPEFIEDPDGKCYTFAWCIRRRDDACIFLAGGRCTIYPYRPWICRTYPFMLDDEDLLISPCPGLGAPLSGGDAEEMASVLLERRSAERLEEGHIREHYAGATLPRGKRVVIDGEGIKVLDV